MEKDKETKTDLSSQQAVAVIGIGLIAMGEEVGSQVSAQAVLSVSALFVLLLLSSSDGFENVRTPYSIR